MRVWKRVGLAGLVAFWLSLAFGFKAPYLTTANSVEVRQFIVFPALLVPWVVLVAVEVARHVRGDRSGLLLMIRSADGVLRRAGAALGMIASCVAASAFLAWVSSDFAPCRTP